MLVERISLLSRKARVFLLPQDEMVVHRRVIPRTSNLAHPFIHFGGERHCESFKVKCLTQEHNRDQGGNEATAPPNMFACSLLCGIVTSPDGKLVNRG